jgi:hypothetical protein
VISARDFLFAVAHGMVGALGYKLADWLMP